jgi:hypothetical protein
MDAEIMISGGLYRWWGDNFMSNITMKVFI